MLKFLEKLFCGRVLNTAAAEAQEQVIIAHNKLKIAHKLNSQLEFKYNQQIKKLNEQTRQYDITLSAYKAFIAFLLLIFVIVHIIT